VKLGLGFATNPWPATVIALGAMGLAGYFFYVDGDFRHLVVHGLEALAIALVPQAWALARGEPQAKESPS
jgi:hypothetical protein